MDNRSKLFECVKKMEEDVGMKKWDQLAVYFTDDFKYKVANKPVAHGVEGLKQYMLWQNALVLWKGHEIHLVAEQDHVLVVEVTSFFQRLADEKVISIPCTDIYRFRGKKIYDWRVYADISWFDQTVIT
ncbi:nuclear transport factor 2 family protein [Fulvivirga sp. M361]|uniref:nuclear transport factor 2 family protein n=1 Tax=Fulvivirga sp. M361 TaxID=2594266 RepID=UPI00117997FC|nr:nuclear transport factor 2 family protein [Fulvivirga sp. M361]TRX62588.1 nuclear transport factor 2 family protein [Fulvivirga sp. M361]